MASTGDEAAARTPMEKVEDPSAAEPAEINYRGWKVMPFIVGNEIFEKLGTIGTSSNLVVYLTTVFHLRNVTAATLVNIFNGTTHLAPLLGAVLADGYLGRYTTLAFASIASQLGLLIIMLTAAISKLHPPHCELGRTCSGPNSVQLAVLLLGLGFMVIGAGGIRPCNLAFGADQFNPYTESGKSGINSFFNLYYLTFYVAMIVSATAIIYVQSNVSWAAGLAIPAALMVFSCVFFFLGTKMYVMVRPEGSPFVSIARVLVAAFKKRTLRLPDDPKQSLFDPPHFSFLVSKLSHTDQFRILDKAAIVTPEDSVKENGLPSNPWKLCSLQQVEQVKCVLRVIPIWSTSIIYQMASTQQTTYVVFQALQSDRHLAHSKFEIPAGSFIVFPMLALTIWVALYDRVIAPRLRTTMLQRMGTGLALCVIAMIASGFIEDMRRSYALHHPTLGIAPNSGGGAVSSFSSLWLIPQLALLGISEALAVISQVEFYYKQFPENMRSVAGSLLFCGFAFGNFLSGLMVTIVHRNTGGDGKANWLAEDLNKGRLDLFYFLLAATGALNFIYFIVCAKWYRYKA